MSLAFARARRSIAPQGAIVHSEAPTGASAPLPASKMHIGDFRTRQLAFGALDRVEHLRHACVATVADVIQPFDALGPRELERRAPAHLRQCQPLQAHRPRLTRGA